VVELPIPEMVENHLRSVAMLPPGAPLLPCVPVRLECLTYAISLVDTHVLDDGVAFLTCKSDRDA
jgi:hypothetical protein